MDIEHIKLGGSGAFIIKGDGKRLAEMTYVNTGEGGFNINHTEVDESLRGQKVGDRLLAEAVRYARESNLKISASCSFALKKLQENADYSDIFEG